MTDLFEKLFIFSDKTWIKEKINVFKLQHKNRGYISYSNIPALFTDIILVDHDLNINDFSNDDHKIMVPRFCYSNDLEKEDNPE